MKIACIGEILWDVFPDKELLGGATFNFAYHAARLGHEVEFVSAVGDDERGVRARAAAAQTSVSTRNIQTTAEAQTGSVTVIVDESGQPDYIIHRPAAYDFINRTQVLGVEGSAWFYYGTLHQMSAEARSTTAYLIERSAGAKLFYDVNLRKDSYEPKLIESLAEQADFMKLNDDEAAELGRIFDIPRRQEAFCRRAAERFDLEGVCVTRGSQGCAILLDQDFAEPSGVAVQLNDAVGAGDAFAAGLLDAFSKDMTAAAAGTFANRVGALVASLPGGTPNWSPADIEKLQAG